MPMAAFRAMDVATSDSYAGVTNFWAQNGKAIAGGTPNGWVAIVAEGKDYEYNVSLAQRIDVISQAEVAKYIPDNSEYNNVDYYYDI